MASHLGDPADIIQRLVASALGAKVNADGVRSKYSHDNKYDFLEALAGKAIRDAARAALEKIVAEQRPQIQKAIEEELRKRPKKTAAAIVSAFASSGHMNRYTTKVSFCFEERE